MVNSFLKEGVVPMALEEVVHLLLKGPSFDQIMWTVFIQSSTIPFWEGCRESEDTAVSKDLDEEDYLDS